MGVDDVDGALSLIRLVTPVSVDDGAPSESANQHVDDGVVDDGTKTASPSVRATYDVATANARAAFTYVLKVAFGTFCVELLALFLATLSGYWPTPVAMTAFDRSLQLGLLPNETITQVSGSYATGSPEFSSYAASTAFDRFGGMPFGPRAFRWAYSISRTLFWFGVPAAVFLSTTAQPSTKAFVNESVLSNWHTTGLALFGLPLGATAVSFIVAFAGFFRDTEFEVQGGQLVESLTWVLAVSLPFSAYCLWTQAYRKRGRGKRLSASFMWHLTVPTAIGICGPLAFASYAVFPYFEEFSLIFRVVFASVGWFVVYGWVTYLLRVGVMRIIEDMDEYGDIVDENGLVAVSPIVSAIGSFYDRIFVVAIVPWATVTREDESTAAGPWIGFLLSALLNALLRLTSRVYAKQFDEIVKLVLIAVAPGDWESWLESTLGRDPDTETRGADASEELGGEGDRWTKSLRPPPSVRADCVLLTDASSFLAQSMFVPIMYGSVVSPYATLADTSFDSGSTILATLFVTAALVTIESTCVGFFYYTKRQSSFALTIDIHRRHCVKWIAFVWMSVLPVEVYRVMGYVTRDVLA